MIHRLKRLTVGVLLAILAISAIASVGIPPLEAHASSAQAPTTPVRVLLARATGGAKIVVPSGHGIHGATNAYYGSFETDLYGYCTPGCASYYAVSSACHVYDDGYGATQYLLSCRLLRAGSQIYGPDTKNSGSPINSGSPMEYNLGATWVAQLAGSESNQWGVIENSNGQLCGTNTYCASPTWGVQASFKI